MLLCRIVSDVTSLTVCQSVSCVSPSTRSVSTPRLSASCTLMAVLHFVSVILNSVVEVFCEFYGRAVRKMPELLLLNYLLNVLTHMVA